MEPGRVTSGYTTEGCGFPCLLPSGGITSGLPRLAFYTRSSGAMRALVLVEQELRQLTQARFNFVDPVPHLRLQPHILKCFQLIISQTFLSNNA